MGLNSNFIRITLLVELMINGIIFRFIRQNSTIYALKI